MRVVESAHGTGFAFEAVTELGGGEFDGYDAVQKHIAHV